MYETLAILAGFAFFYAVVASRLERTPAAFQGILTWRRPSSSGRSAECPETQQSFDDELVDCILAELDVA